MRCPGSVPRSTTAAGSSAGAPRLDQPRARSPAGGARPCRSTSVPGNARERVPVDRALGLRGVLVAGDERDRGRLVAVRHRDAGVRGRRDPGGDARGRPRTGRPAAASASASSPPRPNTNGSPPFRRTTVAPVRPCSTSSALISSCDIESAPGRLADVDAAPRRAARRRARPPESAGRTGSRRRARSARARAASSARGRQALLRPGRPRRKGYGPRRYLALACCALITIPISHYCEKARWALDRAGIAYREERHIQGVHQIAARRAGGGKTVPVLVTPDGVLAESADILAWVDERTPPADAAPPGGPGGRGALPPLRREARPARAAAHVRPRAEGQASSCSASTTPASRAGRTARCASGGRWSCGSRRASSTSRRASSAQDEAIVWREFDFAAELLADGRPYLCGERFSAADLTFAALAAPMVVPPEYTVRAAAARGCTLPRGPRALIERAREHPAGRARARDVQAASASAGRRSRLSQGSAVPSAGFGLGEQRPAPAASIRSASSRPSADGSSASPSSRSRIHARAVRQPGVALDREPVAVEPRVRADRRVAGRVERGHDGALGRQLDERARGR